MALALALVPVSSGQKLESSPFHGDPVSIGVGKATFRLRCSACHGIRAEGGKGPALDRGEFVAGETDLDLYRVIAGGVPGTEMPAFGARSTEENLWRIVAYLRTFQPSGDADPLGDPDRGEEIFWNEGGCGGCHKVGRRGGAFGPSLSRIGRARSTEYLRDALLEPDKDLPSGYYVVTVTTGDGRTVRGIGLGYDDFSAQLIDGSGTIHSFLREQVASIEREFSSLMPATYRESLTEMQRNDVLAYMQSLRGEGDRQ